MRPVMISVRRIFQLLETTKETCPIIERGRRRNIAVEKARYWRGWG
jgi:hypothetical protein